MRAANFVWSAVRFRSAFLDQQLEPEVYHLNPEKSDTDSYRNMMRLGNSLALAMQCDNDLDL